MSINFAEQLEENEQYDKAYEEYKKVYTQKPKSLDVLERLGHLATILHKPDDAIEYYNKILELDSTSVLAYEQLMDFYVHKDRFKYYIARGNLHVVQQELSHAISDFKKALDKAQSANEMNSTRFVLASLYEQTGKTHQAIDEYLRILDTQSIDEHSQGGELVYLKLAGLYEAENSITSAIDVLERAREKGFSSEAINETLAHLYLKSDSPDKARGLTQDELVMVKSYLDEGQNQSAFEILQKNKDKFKKDCKYYSLLAQYYFNIKDWDKALESVAEFDKLQKNSPLTYQMKALIYEEKGNDFESHINWAKYNLARGDKDVALNEYFMAHQIKDNDLDLVRNIAELLETSGDKMQAAEFWEKLAGLDSANKVALIKCSEFKERIGDYRAQAEILEKLYLIDSKDYSVVKNLAKAYEKVKNKEKALEFYNKFISISPVNDEYEEIKLKIQKLESTEMEEDEGLLEKFMKIITKKR